ncbi:MAG: MmgE/PrpD family protein [Chloroflexi bacterium]|nr:MmgE/PrpD family protein [Chloroflexota bacterium]
MDEGRNFTSFLAEFAYGDLDRAVIERTQDLILDQLGVQIAASTRSWSIIAYKYARGIGGRPESTIVNYGDKVGTEMAAFANATFGHGFEMDDSYFPGSTHPACVVVSTALAVGEREALDGKKVLTAVVAGYETMGRITRAASPTLVKRGFHPTSLSGTHGAAIVTGKLQGMDARTMLDAFAITGSHSSGIMEYSEAGGSVKRLHAGIAAIADIRSGDAGQIGTDWSANDS